MFKGQKKPHPPPAGTTTGTTTSSTGRTSTTNPPKVIASRPATSAVRPSDNAANQPAHRPVSAPHNPSAAALSFSGHPPSSTRQSPAAHQASAASNSAATLASAAHQCPAPNLKHELYIAELAVQRAALATKRVLADLPTQTRQIAQPISQFQHPTTATAGQAPGGLSLAKADKSPVTIADFAAQALLICALRKHFPEYGFLGEEDANALRADPKRELANKVWKVVSTTKLADQELEALLGQPRTLDDMLDLIDRGNGNKVANGRCWVMDPVDGTSAFMEGGQYAISLALLQDGKEILGVLGCPSLRTSHSKLQTGSLIDERDVDKDGIMLAAVKGQGATVRPLGRGKLLVAEKLDRSRDKKPDSQLRDLHFVDSSGSPKTLSSVVKALAEKVRVSYPGTNLYSSHMRYAAMALGTRSYVQIRVPKSRVNPKTSRPEKPWDIWDHCGSHLIYTESGPSKVTDLSGNPIDFGAEDHKLSGWGIITADADVHGKVLMLVEEILAESRTKR